MELWRKNDTTQEVSGKPKELSYDFVTWRGVMTRIGGTPYEKQDGWVIYGRRLGGTIFLCETKTQKAMAREESRGEHERMMGYGGYKFETFCCSKDGVASHPEPEFTSDQWCVVFETKLETLNILFGAEIDCENPQTEGEFNFVELSLAEPSAVKRLTGYQTCNR